MFLLVRCVRVDYLVIHMLIVKQVPLACRVTVGLAIAIKNEAKKYSTIILYQSINLQGKSALQRMKPRCRVPCAQRDRRQLRLRRAITTRFFSSIYLLNCHVFSRAQWAGIWFGVRAGGRGALAKRGQRDPTPKPLTETHWRHLSKLCYCLKLAIKSNTCRYPTCVLTSSCENTNTVLLQGCSMGPTCLQLWKYFIPLCKLNENLLELKYYLARSICVNHV